MLDLLQIISTADSRQQAPHPSCAVNHWICEQSLPSNQQESRKYHMQMGGAPLLTYIRFIRKKQDQRHHNTQSLDAAAVYKIKDQLQEHHYNIANLAKTY